MNGINKLPRVPILKCEYKCGRDSTGVIKGKYMCADCYLDRDCISEACIEQPMTLPHWFNFSDTVSQRYGYSATALY